MFLVGLISWWYTGGWRTQWSRAVDRFLGTVDFFSLGQLLETFFDPFRQISAGGAIGGSLGDAFRAFLDKLFSRIVGAVIRFGTILIGVCAIVLQALYQLVILVAWLFVPVLPLAGLIMFAIGWIPSWM